MEVTEEFLAFRCDMGKRRQQEAREGFWWATPRCRAPGHDATRAALNLIVEVSDRAKNYTTVLAARHHSPGQGNGSL